MRKLVPASVFCLAAFSLAASGVLGAQSRKTNGEWNLFHAPDTSFVVLFPAGGPDGHLTKAAGPVTEFVYFDEAGTTSLTVHEWVQPPGSALVPVPDFDNFCTACLGRVVADSTVTAAPYDGRWVYAEGAPTDSGGRKISVHRLLTVGQKRYLIAAISAPGQPLSPNASWYLESFTACKPWVACNPFGAAKAGPAPPSAPFDALLPTVRGKEVAAAPPPLNRKDGHASELAHEHAQLLPGAPSPRYPEELKYENLKGTAQVSFVVDTTGRVDSTSFKVIEATHKLFGEAAREAVLKMKFVPAEIGGKKVRELVQQKFVFDRWNPDRPLQ